MWSSSMVPQAMYLSVVPLNPKRVEGRMVSVIEDPSFQKI